MSVREEEYVCKMSLT